MRLSLVLYNGHKCLSVNGYTVCVILGAAGDQPWYEDVLLLERCWFSCWGVTVIKPTLINMDGEDDMKEALVSMLCINVNNFNFNDCFLHGPKRADQLPLS